MFPDKIVICKTDKNICEICDSLYCNRNVDNSNACIICFGEGSYLGNEKIFHYSANMYHPNGNMVRRIIKTEEEVLKLIVRTKNEKDRTVLKYIFKNFDKMELL